MRDYDVRFGLLAVNGSGVAFGSCVIITVPSAHAHAHQRLAVLFQSWPESEGGWTSAQAMWAHSIDDAISPALQKEGVAPAKW
jgi:hypothetical protein